MAWSSIPDWKVVSHRKVNSLSIQSRTRTGWEIKQTPLIVNGVATAQMVSYQAPYQYEQRRNVFTVVEETVSEANGLTENAIAVSQSLSPGAGQDGSYTYTEISKALANPAGGYTFRKLERTVSITEGTWAFHERLIDDSPSS